MHNIVFSTLEHLISIIVCNIFEALLIVLVSIVNNFILFVSRTIEHEVRSSKLGMSASRVSRGGCQIIWRWVLFRKHFVEQGFVVTSDNTFFLAKDSPELVLQHTGDANQIHSHVQSNEQATIPAIRHSDLPRCSRLCKLLGHCDIVNCSNDVGWSIQGSQSPVLRDRRAVIQESEINHEI